jgi:hypothetical protein
MEELGQAFSWHGYETFGAVKDDVHESTLQKHRTESNINCDVAGSF